MAQSKVGALLRLTVMLALVVGLAVSPFSARAQDDDGDGDASVVIHGGNVSTTTVFGVGADGGVGTSGATGGDLNSATTEAIAGDTGDTANTGNGGAATSDATGGSISNPPPPAAPVADPGAAPAPAAEPAPGPISVDAGGNTGNTITVGDTSAGPAATRR